MSTGYYKPDMTPPEYEGKSWSQRVVEYEDGERIDRTIQSPFPPATIGNPAEDVPAFRDFQDWASRDRRREHPDWYCQGCGLRYAVAICPACKSGRTVMTDAEPAVECGHRCVSCKFEFLGLLLCGPCIDDRQKRAQIRTDGAPAGSTAPGTVQKIMAGRLWSRVA